jgi:hypothetical protein
MTTLNLSMRLRGVLLHAVIGAACLVVTACDGGGVIANSGGSGGGGSGGGGGGGGPSVNASPYTLFASNYAAYSSAQTNGSFLHSVQNGDVFTGFGGNFSYGCYSFSQADMDSHQFYALQGIANSTYSPGPPESCSITGNVAPTNVADYFYVNILAPGTNLIANGGTAPASIAPLDISQSTAMLIQMGNIYTSGDVPGAVGGHANVFTVVLDNGTVPGQVNAGTAECFRDVALLAGSIGRGPVAPLGVLNYKLNLADVTWICTTGSMAIMQSTGVTAVTVKFTGDKNPGLVVGDYDLIAVGYIGFTK